MPVQPSTDSELHSTGDRQTSAGWNILLAGGILFAIGLVLMLIGGEFVSYVGVVFAALATPPTLGGIAMLLSGFTSKRHAQHKPFA